MSTIHGGFRQHWREVIATFLKIGALSYGGAASTGIMQLEVQDKRAWVSKEQFIEGLALVNTLPGPTGIQLGIFLGYNRAGWWGGVLVGLCFILPAFCILLSLTLIYHRYGALPRMRHLFYGLSPVVVGTFTMSVYRLGQVAIRDMRQVLLAVAGALAIGLTPLGIVPPMIMAGSVGVALYGLRLGGIVSALAIVVHSGAYFWAGEWFTIPAFSGTDIDRPVSSLSPGLWEVGLFFFKVGAFTFGGGLTILAFMQDQVVNHLHWLTPQQFLDGLALGQLTPGPLLMLAAFDESHVTGYQPRSDRHDRRGGAAHAALCDTGPRRRNTGCGNRGGDGTLAPQSLAAHDRRCRHGACPARPNILTAPICGAAPRRHHAAQ